MKKLTKRTALMLIPLLLLTFCLPVCAEESTSAAAEEIPVDFDVAAMSDEEAFTFMHDFTNRTPDLLDADEGKVMHIQDSSFLEQGQGYDQEKVLRFFKNWTPKAVK